MKAEHPDRADESPLHLVASLVESVGEVLPGLERALNTTIDPKGFGMGIFFALLVDRGINPVMFCSHSREEITYALDAMTSLRNDVQTGEEDA